MGWYETVRDAFFEALCAAFGLNPDSQEAKNRFIPAYIENDITPQAPRNVNVCYYAINDFQGDSGLNYIMLKANGLLKTEITKSIPKSVLATFYGPSADDDSEEFWSLFQWDSGANSPRGVLRKRNIVPIGRPSRPITLYEVEGTYQRRRCDVRVDIAYLETKQYVSTEITEPPDVTVKTQGNN